MTDDQHPLDELGTVFQDAVMGRGWIEERSTGSIVQLDERGTTGLTITRPDNASEIRVAIYLSPRFGQNQVIPLPPEVRRALIVKLLQIDGEQKTIGERATLLADLYLDVLLDRRLDTDDARRQAVYRQLSTLLATLESRP